LWDIYSKTSRKEYRALLSGRLNGIIIRLNYNLDQIHIMGVGKRVCFVVSPLKGLSHLIRSA
jgi:hypothetical protein